jgi:hypothetical protein
MEKEKKEKQPKQPLSESLASALDKKYNKLMKKQKRFAAITSADIDEGLMKFVDGVKKRDKKK